MSEREKILTDKMQVDEEGFLLENEKWTREIAEILAQGEISGELTDDHWLVINYMREYYEKWGSVPPPRMMARRIGLSLGRIKELFPMGLTRGACKYAGIPRIAIRPSFLYP